MMRVEEAITFEVCVLFDNSQCGDCPGHLLNSHNFLDAATWKEAADIAKLIGRCCLIKNLRNSKMSEMFVLSVKIVVENMRKTTTFRIELQHFN